MTKFYTFAAILLAGCTTTLTSKKVDSGFPLALSDVGSTYYLPKQTINVAITYELKSCEQAGAKMNISKSATINTSNSPDGNARFHVPAASLSSGNKTTSITVSTFDNGTLRSLGGTIDDRTSEIIGGIISTTGSVIRSASGLGVEFSTPPVNNTNCSDTLNIIVKDRDELMANLRKADRYTGVDEREGAIEALNRLIAATRVTRTIRYTPEPNPEILGDYHLVSQRFDTSSGTKAVLESWMKDSAKSKPTSSELLMTVICIGPGVDGGNKLTNDKNGCGAKTLLSLPILGSPSNDGLTYRDPKYVNVNICGKTCKDETIGRSQVALAQFGPWRSIKLTSKAFQDKNVMASWNNTGRLTSLTIGSSSSLEAIANTLNTSAESIRGTIGEVVTTDQEALNAEIALIRSQADLIEQQNRLNALQNSTTD